MLLIIGTNYVDYERIKTFIHKPAGLCVYVESLVPSWARHIKGITDNQRYYIAIHVRKMLSIGYKDRMELVNELVKGIHLCGTMTTFTPITDIVESCDKEMLRAMLCQEVVDE